MIIIFQRPGRISWWCTHPTSDGDVEFTGTDAAGNIPTKCFFLISIETVGTPPYSVHAWFHRVCENCIKSSLQLSRVLIVRLFRPVELSGGASCDSSPGYASRRVGALPRPHVNGRVGRLWVLMQILSRDCLYFAHNGGVCILHSKRSSTARSMMINNNINDNPQLFQVPTNESVAFHRSPVWGKEPICSWVSIFDVQWNYPLGMRPHSRENEIANKCSMVYIWIKEASRIKYRPAKG